MSHDHIKGEKTVFNMVLTAFNELKGQVSLENISEEFKYTKDCMQLFQRGHTRANVNWEEMKMAKKNKKKTSVMFLTKRRKNSGIYRWIFSGKPWPNKSQSSDLHERIEQPCIAFEKRNLKKKWL